MVSEEKIFEKCERTDDGPWVYYKLTWLSCGSGELKHITKKDKKHTHKKIVDFNALHSYAIFRFSTINKHKDKTNIMHICKAKILILRLGDSGFKHFGKHKR